MKLGLGELPAGPWRVIAMSEFIRLVFDVDQTPKDRPWILAIDGRSGSGKSTLATLLQRAVPASAVVHTDDVAWHHSFFGWSDLLIEGVLNPLRLGKAVNYRPPGWDTHGRSGGIKIAAGLDLILIEGVGSSRHELATWLDRSVWVQSDLDEAERRGIARDGDSEAARAFWHEWMSQESEFFQQQQPWERANIIVNGTPQQPYDQNTEVVVSSTTTTAAG